MNFFEALVLGIIQGLTEFLPVSSSGHLELGKAIFGTDIGAKESLLFTLTLHMATSLSTMIVFRRKLIDLFKKIMIGEKESMAFLLKIIASMIPAVLVGYFLEDFIASVYDKNLFLVGLMLLFTAVILLISDRIKTPGSKLSYLHSIVLGISQAIAIIPGISRSGATITTGIFLNVNRKITTEFSFLMVIPIIFGSMLYSVLEADNTIVLTVQWMPLVVGFLSSFVVGILACLWMVRLVINSQLIYFSIYCALVGLTALVYEVF
ncbi:MAG: undecaprenyl-diphosphate phosphatase [Flavobacteriaceae bacterium]|nr:undecaprenyl-diphosphate phosphatase [Flavobacteriaceae bacterium]